MSGLARHTIAGLVVATGLLVAAFAGAESERERFSIDPSLTLTFEANDNGNLALEGTDTGWSYGSWLEPRLVMELDRDRWSAGADLGADLRYSFDDSRLRDAFVDLRAFIEVEALRGLTLRLTESFVPQSVRLGSPTDDIRNLRQSNRILAQASYRRELQHGRSFELGLHGERFDGQGFEASIDLDGDGLPNPEGDLHPDFWGAGVHLELQQGIGRHGVAYLRSEMRERSFDEIPRADFSEWSTMAGLRRQLAQRLELDVALGYGEVEYEDLPSNGRLLGRAKLDYSMPKGWGLQGLFVQRFTSDAGGYEFDETSVRLGLSKRLGSRTRASVGGLWSRYHPDAPTSDRNWVKALDVSLERQLSRRIKSVLAWRQWRNGGAEENDDFTQNRVILGFTYTR